MAVNASIKERLAQMGDTRETENLRPLLEAILADQAALTAQLGQLITDYNANATIADDTTAVAPTLTLAA